ncbi:MAG: DUF928 domain-containing protein [Gammaproteobacteria bacterium]|nr:DUF928 domain-containing protein [Gammaproteobacteria bacterium]
MSNRCNAFVTGLLFTALMSLSSLTGLLLPAQALHAAEPPAAGFPIYKPPLRGTPAARVGGGTRGEGDDVPAIYVLAPEHTGLTSQPQPVLYWYLSNAIEAGYEFVLIADGEYEPLVEIKLTGVETAGIQRIALADLGVSLKPDVQYQWSVTIVMDAQQRSGDVLASGMIEYIKPPAAIMTRVANARGEERIRHYAGAGLWYDALQSLDEQIKSQPGTGRLQQVRASLLKQVGLDKVAAAAGG